jgi:hypothetical protein
MPDDMPAENAEPYETNNTRKTPDAATMSLRMLPSGIMRFLERPSSSRIRSGTVVTYMMANNVHFSECWPKPKSVFPKENGKQRSDHARPSTLAF